MYSATLKVVAPTSKRRDSKRNARQQKKLAVVLNEYELENLQAKCSNEMTMDIDTFVICINAADEIHRQMNA